MTEAKGNWDHILRVARAKSGTVYEDLQNLSGVLKNFIQEEEFAVVYPRISLSDSEEIDDGMSLELVVLTADGRIIVASVLPYDRFEINVTHRSEICNLRVTGILGETSQEMRPALSIYFKDGSQLDLDSEEDANQYWGEEYPDLIGMIINQLR